MIYKSKVKFAVKVPSKNVASSKRPSEEKESKAKVAEELIKEDAKNIVPQTIEMLKSLDLHTDEMHKKPSIRTRAAFDLYKPESWMLEAFKQDIKQSLHLAIVSNLMSINPQTYTVLYFLICN